MTPLPSTTSEVSILIRVRDNREKFDNSMRANEIMKMEDWELTVGECTEYQYITGKNLITERTKDYLI